MIANERIQYLNSKPIFENKTYIVYWMQTAQRVLDNHALSYAISQSNERALPLIVFFGITPRFLEANYRHYDFMFDGLLEVENELTKMNIAFIMSAQSPEQGVLRFRDNASCVITDRAYLRIEHQWRTYAAQKLPCSLIQIDTNTIVPIETASPKEEYSAGTFRNKITPLLPSYLKSSPLPKPALSSLHFFNNNDFTKERIRSEYLKTVDFARKTLSLDMSIQPVPNAKGGTTRALKKIERFIEHKLDRYGEERNDPTMEIASGMSPYLHFGQISPISIALKITSSNKHGIYEYLEQLIVRRELAFNFVFYNSEYESISSLPLWATLSLQKHQDDIRSYRYSREQFERANTHDPYWNAAQKELRKSGKIHNYMRMYWGKKILEWSATPTEAWDTALSLNNTYAIDGRDPNSYAGVAWCFGKHDRAWKERPVYGKIRYMNENGLKRKFNIDLYAKKWNLIDEDV